MTKSTYSFPAMMAFLTSRWFVVEEAPSKTGYIFVQRRARV